MRLVRTCAKMTDDTHSSHTHTTHTTHLALHRITAIGTQLRAFILPREPSVKSECPPIQYSTEIL